MVPRVLCNEESTVQLGGLKPVQHPTRLSGSLVWDGADLQETDYTYELTTADIREIEGALDIFKRFELDGPDISPETFPLRNLGKVLRKISREVHNGRGFGVVSGLNPGLYSPEDSALALLGISSYIGIERGMQDSKGRMMVHVRDHGKGPSLGTKASNKPSPFHTEFFCDVLALYVKGEPASGGDMKIAPSWQVYNDLRESRPDVIQALLKPNWKFESRGSIFPEHTRPLLFLHDGRAILNYSRRPLLGRSRNHGERGTGNLNHSQHEALQLLQEAASRRCLTLPSRKGNILFANNLALLHSRDGFTDDAMNSRHIVRLWLRNPTLAWSLPEVLDAGHRRIYGENGRAEMWELTPMRTGRMGKGRRGAMSGSDISRKRSNGNGEAEDGEGSEDSTSGGGTSGGETSGETTNSTSH